MTKHGLLGMLILLGGMILGAGMVQAQNTKDGVIPINGGRNAVYVGAPKTITPAVKPAPGLVTIYSNLGTGSNVYNPDSGTGVLGRDVPGMPYPEWLAFSFVPTADHMVTEIQVGVTYVQGPNTVMLNLSEDNGGFPGQVIRKWIFNNMPDFGSCCTLQTAMLKTPVAVKKGVTYWVVLKTSVTNEGTWLVWNNDFNNVQGHLSNNLGSGWLDGGIQQQGAFGVFGQ